LNREVVKAVLTSGGEGRGLERPRPVVRPVVGAGVQGVFEPVSGVGAAAAGRQA